VKKQATKIADIMTEMVELERQLSDSEFVATYLGGPIVTRVGGIVYKFRPQDYHTPHGCYLWRPKDTRTVRYTRQLDLVERQRFLNKFPKMIVIAVAKIDNHWIVVPWNLEEAGKRFGIMGITEAHLVRGVEPFDVIEVAMTPMPVMIDRARQILPWAHDIDLEHAAGTAEMVAARIQGITPEGRLALQYLFKTSEELKQSQEENRIRMALGCMNADLLSYVEQDETHLVVKWKFQGLEYRTVVQKDDLEVVSAGICLSGKDRKFDLTTIVSVMKERQQRWGDEHMDTYSLW